MCARHSPIPRGPMPTRRDIICESRPCSRPRAPDMAGLTACSRSESANAPPSGSATSSMKCCKMIDLHYSATPNGQKIAILLEEIGAPYHVLSYDIFNGDQLTAAFGRINPNHKLPAIVDRDPAGGGAPVTVFESGEIGRAHV